MEFDDLSNPVIGCALEVHREMGPGFLESTYGQGLAHELRLNKPAGITTGLPMNFNARRLKNGIKRFGLRSLRALRVLRGGMDQHWEQKDPA